MTTSSVTYYYQNHMSSRCLNRLMLIGNLTRDPELRYTPSGTAVCNFGIATNRQWTTSDGEKKEAAQFHRAVSWNQLAELCAQLLFKGAKVYLGGRIQYREWTGDDNVKRQTTEIVVDDMILLTPRRPKTEPKAEEKDSEEKEEGNQEKSIEEEFEEEQEKKSEQDKDIPF